MQDKAIKTTSFVLTVAFFSALSFLIRNILISKFNGYNFKIFSIDHINNYGAAFSILQNHVLILIFLSTVILSLALFYIFRNIDKFKKQDILFTAILSSGILCNLAERIIDGHVTDYIRLNFVAFPIFNMSDIFICIGAFILICNILFNDEQNT